MQRKWMITVATMFTVTAMIAGISLAADDEGPLHELMEKVNKSSNAIKKATRTAVFYKKAQASKELSKNTEELIKLSKEASELSKDALKKAKGAEATEKEWKSQCETFTKELEEFHTLISKSSTDQAAAKKAYSKVGASCSNCHKIFRVEEDSF